MGATMNSLDILVKDLAHGRVKVVDLTKPLGPDTPVLNLPPMFASSPPFSRELISRYDEKGPAWYWNTIHLGEHTGTHFDAPVHWVSGKDLPDNTLDRLPVRKLVGPACVIDMRREAEADEDFLLTREHVEEWEQHHGRIASGSWVLLRTDWSKRQDAKRFLNMREDGPHSPGFRCDSIQFLANERDVLGVGNETVGTDAGQAATFDPPFPAHYFMQGSGRFGLASLCNLDQLPPVGAVVIASPLKIVDGSGSPTRVLALVPA